MRFNLRKPSKSKGAGGEQPQPSQGPREFFKQTPRDKPPQPEDIIASTKHGVGAIYTVTPRGMRRVRSQSVSLAEKAAARQPRTSQRDVTTRSNSENDPMGNGRDDSPILSPRKSTEWKVVTSELSKRMQTASASVEATHQHQRQRQNNNNNNIGNAGVPPRFEISPAARSILTKKEQQRHRRGLIPQLRSKETYTTHDSSFVSEDRSRNHSVGTIPSQASDKRRRRQQGKPSMSWAEESLVEVASPRRVMGAMETLTIFAAKNNNKNKCNRKNDSSSLDGNNSQRSNSMSQYPRQRNINMVKIKSGSVGGGSSVVSKGERSMTSKKGDGTNVSQAPSVASEIASSTGFRSTNKTNTTATVKFTPQHIRRSRSKSLPPPSQQQQRSTASKSSVSKYHALSNRSVASSSKLSSLSTGPKEILADKVSAHTSAVSLDRIQSVALSLGTIKTMIHDRMEAASKEDNDAATIKGSHVGRDGANLTPLSTSSSSFCFWGCEAIPMDQEKLRIQKAELTKRQHQEWLEYVKLSIYHAKHGITAATTETAAAAVDSTKKEVNFPIHQRLPLIETDIPTTDVEGDGESTDDEDEIRSISSVDLLVRWIGNCGEPDLSDHFPPTQKEKLALHQAAKARTPRGGVDKGALTRGSPRALQKSSSPRRRRRRHT